MDIHCECKHCHQVIVNHEGLWVLSHGLHPAECDRGVCTAYHEPLCVN